MAESLLDRIMIGIIQIILIVVLWIVVMAIGFDMFLNGIVKLIQALRTTFGG